MGVLSPYCPEFASALVHDEVVDPSVYSLPAMLNPYAGETMWSAMGLEEAEGSLLASCRAGPLHALFPAERVTSELTHRWVSIAVQSALSKLESGAVREALEAANRLVESFPAHVQVRIARARMYVAGEDRVVDV